LPDSAAVYAKSPLTETLRQGEIVTDLTQSTLRIETIGSEHPIVDDEVHRFAVVLSQDCDLERGFADLAGARANVPSVLFCKCFLADELREVVKRGMSYGSKDWDRVCKNENSRFHYLEAVPPDADALKQGLTAMSLDFRRFFTIPTAEVDFRLRNGAMRRAHIQSPYREHLVQRFFNYQARVALPDPADANPAGAATVLVEHSPTPGGASPTR
jgi:hypothetical protein